MASTRRTARKTALLPTEEAKRRHDLMDTAVLNFHGQVDELEGALGAYMIARHVGWKVIHLIHTKATVAKYEKILGIKFREEFPPETVDSERSMAYIALQKFTNFWKVVSGDDKLPLGREERRSLN